MSEGIELKDLLPGKTYRVQVRAKNILGEESPWSEIYEFSTPLALGGDYNISSVYQTQVGDNSQSSIGGLIKSANFDGAIGSNGNIIPSGTSGSNYGTTGWAIDSAGLGIFNNVVTRGTIYATDGSIGGWTISNDYISHTDSNMLVELNTINSGVNDYALKIYNNLNRLGSPTSTTYSYSRIGNIYSNIYGSPQNIPIIELGYKDESKASVQQIVMYSSTPDYATNSSMHGSPSIQFDDLDGQTAGFLGSWGQYVLSLESRDGSGFVSVSHYDGTSISARGSQSILMYNNITTDHNYNQSALYSDVTYSGYTANALDIRTGRASSTAYDYIAMYANTNGSTLDLVYRVRGDGRVSTDSSSGMVTGGADYAEYFEWEDGNIENEDRVGYTVAINSNRKIEKFIPGTHDESKIIGVISAVPAFTGNAADLSWQNKYLTDEWGRPLEEEYSVIEWDGEKRENSNAKPKKISYHLDMIPDGVVVPESHEIITLDDKGNKLKRKVVNPEYNPDSEYIPRENRKEWGIVGLLGVLKVRADQYKPSRWTKIADVSTDIEEWFVR